MRNCAPPTFVPCKSSGKAQRGKQYRSKRVDRNFNFVSWADSQPGPTLRVTEQAVKGFVRGL